MNEVKKHIDEVAWWGLFAKLTCYDRIVDRVLLLPTGDEDDFSDIGIAVIEEIRR